MDATRLDALRAALADANYHAVSEGAWDDVIACAEAFRALDHVRTKSPKRVTTGCAVTTSHAPEPCPVDGCIFENGHGSLRPFTSAEHVVPQDVRMKENSTGCAGCRGDSYLHDVKCPKAQEAMAKEARCTPTRSEVLDEVRDFLKHNVPCGVGGMMTLNQALGAVEQLRASRPGEGASIHTVYGPVVADPSVPPNEARVGDVTVKNIGPDTSAPCLHSVFGKGTCVLEFGHIGVHALNGNVDAKPAVVWTGDGIRVLSDGVVEHFNYSAGHWWRNPNPSSELQSLAKALAEALQQRTVAEDLFLERAALYLEARGTTFADQHALNRAAAIVRELKSKGAK